MENKDKSVIPPTILIAGKIDQESLELLKQAIDESAQSGLTKLEAFTMAAMQGICSNGEYTEFIRREQQYEILADVVVRESITIANKLLKQLENNG